MILPTTYRASDGLTVEAASPELLSELLGALSFETRRLGIPVDDSLNPGIGRQQIVDGLGEIGLTPPEEALVWWGWHNGLKFGAYRSPALDQISLETSVGMFKTMPLGLADYEWNPDWIVLAGGSPAGMAINCDTRLALPHVRGVDGISGTQAGDVTNQVVSLCTPVTWWLLARAKGWTFPGSDGAWHRDISRFPLEWRLTDLAHY
ncbi:hypothetical protein [Leifsonia virtsii]|uniref:Knr4/Smi1-like domain-containing protein n=1 Tax=Leifsonia virtsii TaxID=3035915 RepID=A0ABT8J2Z2_9MICO|nr:hypothetical protein [Leifsonia virtsii]MDN4598589.1 hypothetical protein [Leifsonia virtsii]